MKKTYINLTVRLVVNHKESLDQVDEGILIDGIVAELDYDFKSNTDGIEIEDYEIMDYEVTKSIDN